MNSSDKNPWLSMASAPTNAREVRVLLKDGTIVERAHYARDLSGSEQPPFEGWFCAVRDSEGKLLYYRGIERPVAWMEVKES